MSSTPFLAHCEPCPVRMKAVRRVLASPMASALPLAAKVSSWEARSSVLEATKALRKGKRERRRATVPHTSARRTVGLARR